VRKQVGLMIPRPYQIPNKRRMRAVELRTGRTPEQQADWVLGPTDVGRLLHRTRKQVNVWMAHGRRQRSQFTFQKLPATDYGLGAEIRMKTRMQDVLMWCVDWNMPLWVNSPQDELLVQRARVALILTKHIDPLPLIQVTYTHHESED
jgi:hypothetical protein